jgi:hypothetical protein
MQIVIVMEVYNVIQLMAALWYGGFSPKHQKHYRQAVICHGTVARHSSRTLIWNTMHNLGHERFSRCTKRVSSPTVTHSYLFRPCWVIFRENFFVTVTLRLHFTVEWEIAVYWRRELYAVPACRPGPQRVHASKNNAVHSQQHILTQL